MGAATGNGHARRAAVGGAASGLPAYLVFEGGGAKGVAHVGVMRCLEEERRVDVRGVAGTSAGAIFAAFVAAGFRSRELYDFDAPESRRGILEKGLARVFDEGAFADMEAAGKTLTARGTAKKGPRGWPKRITCLPGMLRIRRLARQVADTRGLMSITPLRDWIEQELQAKIRGSRIDPTRPVRFSELPIDLKVVATDITHQCMTVYQRPSDGAYDAAVSDAVAASACIPFIFEPYESVDAEGRTATLVDGGLTSNFPFWLFETERLAHDGHRVPIIGVRLAAPLAKITAAKGRYPAGTPGTGRFISDMLAAATSGSENPRNMPIRNIHALSFGVDVETVDFKKADSELNAITRAAYLEAFHAISKTPHLGAPDLINEYLKFYHAAFTALLPRADGMALRANIMIPVSDTEHMVYFSLNMQDHADDCLTLPLTTGVAARAYGAADGKHIITRLESVDEGGLDKYQKALVWPQLKTMLTIPLRKDDGAGSVGAILNFDCNHDITDALQTDAASTLAAQAGRSLSFALFGGASAKDG